MLDIKETTSACESSNTSESCIASAANISNLGSAFQENIIAVETDLKTKQGLTQRLNRDECSDLIGRSESKPTLKITNKKLISPDKELQVSQNSLCEAPRPKSGASNDAIEQTESALPDVNGQITLSNCSRDKSALKAPQGASELRYGAKQRPVWLQDVSETPHLQKIIKGSTKFFAGQCHLFDQDDSAAKQNDYISSALLAVLRGSQVLCRWNSPLMHQIQRVQFMLSKVHKTRQKRPSQPSCQSVCAISDNVIVTSTRECSKQLQKLQPEDALLSKTPNSSAVGPDSCFQQQADPKSQDRITTTKPVDLVAKPGSRTQKGWLGRVVSKVFGALKLPLFAALLHSMPGAYGEEESILKDAYVSKEGLYYPETRYLANDLIGKGFKNFVYFNEDPTETGSAEFSIIFNGATKIRTVFIINYCFNYYGEERRYYIGSSELLVGSNRTPFSDANQVVASNIFDGGFHDLPSPSGNVVTFRRRGPNPLYGNSRLRLNEIRVYETPNLLKEYQGSINITPDTSTSLSGYEARNLLANLESRSCGGNKPSAITSPYRNGSAGHRSQNTCFKATQSQLRSNDDLFILGLEFRQSQFIHAIVLAQDMLDTWFTEAVDQTELFQNYSIYIGGSSDYWRNSLCVGSPFQRFSSSRSYHYSAYADQNDLNPYGMGRGEVWPFGAEHWCNLEGQYMHIVSDMGELRGRDYETSICSLGVMGTRYVRNGNGLETDTDIEIFTGESKRFTLNHIYSELEIGTSLMVEVKLSSSKDFVKIDNSKDGYTEIRIETTRETPDGYFTLDFESFNAMSNVESTLKTDTMRLHIIRRWEFDTDLPDLIVIAGRDSTLELPERIAGSYAQDRSETDFLVEKKEFQSLLSYDQIANEINYNALTNDGYELRKLTGEQTITITLVDIKSYSKSFEMSFTFIVPLIFQVDPLDMNVTAGKVKSVQLPYVIEAKGYQQANLIVSPRDDIWRNQLSYDEDNHAVTYTPESRNFSKLKDFVGKNTIDIALVDNEQIRYNYEMTLDLTVPLLIKEDIKPFPITNGVASATQLPSFIIADGYKLKETKLVSNLESDSFETAKYFNYNDADRTISYIAPEVCDTSIEIFLQLKMIQIKLIDDYDDEYIYDLAVEIDDQYCDPPSRFTASEMPENAFVQISTLSDERTYSFPRFDTGQACCEVKYYFFSKFAGGEELVKNWNELERTFTFEYDEDLETFNNNSLQDYQDYEFTIQATSGLTTILLADAKFTLRLVNPCSEMANYKVTRHPTWCSSSEEADMPDWMRDLRNFTIYGGQETSHIMYNLGERKGSEIVTADLGYAAPFARHNGDQNTLTISGLTLNNVSENRILMKIYQSENDPQPVKKYVYIFITDRRDDIRRSELSFTHALTSFNIVIGQSAEKPLPRIRLNELKKIKSISIQPDEKLLDQLSYDETSRTIKYDPMPNMTEEDSALLVGNMLTQINIIDGNDNAFVYQMKTNASLITSNWYVVIILIAVIFGVVFVLLVIRSLACCALTKRRASTDRRLEEEDNQIQYDKRQELNQHQTTRDLSMIQDALGGLQTVELHIPAPTTTSESVVVPQRTSIIQRTQDRLIVTFDERRPTPSYMRRTECEPQQQQALSQMMVEFDLERFEELPSELRNQDTRELEGTEESDY